MFNGFQLSANCYFNKTLDVKGQFSYFQTENPGIIIKMIIFYMNTLLLLFIVIGYLFIRSPETAAPRSMKSGRNTAGANITGAS